jgi:hypothetical protein
MFERLSFLAFFLAAAVFYPTAVLAQAPGSFVDGGNTLVSAMMLFLGNTEKVYILDKAEGNAAQINGHPAWGAVWDIGTRQSTVMDIRTNVFCAAGMHLPNGSYVTFGGNGAVGPGGAIGSQANPGGGSGAFDNTYQDYDGATAIRILNPCTNSDDFNSPNCQWFDDPAVLSMQKRRWYAAAEPLANGTVVLIGGFVNGGYINRNYPNTDPAFEGGAAEPTYEFFPSNGVQPQIMQFMIKTSGLNSYAHTFLLASGKMFVQANYSTMIWDYNNNIETDLPDMPNNIVRVYPASGAVAMLPLTPANNYSQTILFCGGQSLSGDADWGNYANPAVNTWEYPASSDCQRITPEPADGSPPTYIQDDNMLDTRTMGQFIILPNGKLLVINGANNGTAGYATQTGQTPNLGLMPYGESLAGGPVGRPSIYDPNAPAGQRWSSDGLDTSNIARLYHSSAMLLPDGSVMVAGSNPNVDVNTSTIYPTTYQAEIFYPPYFASSMRPIASGIPKTISYGGNPFDITVSAKSYAGSANDAAANTTVVLIRGGFTTHAMNMGQRFLQLNNTYTVNSDGSITLHVAQAPPNPNIFQPGPALFWVVINGVPSNGTMVIVGNGQIANQPTQSASVLPPNVPLDSSSGGGAGSDKGNGSSSGTSSKSHTILIVGGVVGGIAVIGIIGGLVGLFISRRKRASLPLAPKSSYAMGSTTGSVPMGARMMRSSDSSAFMPMEHEAHSMVWNGSNVSLNPPSSPVMYTPYQDDPRASGTGMSLDFDPYSSRPMSGNVVRY